MQTGTVPVLQLVTQESFMLISYAAHEEIMRASHQWESEHASFASDHKENHFTAFQLAQGQIALSRLNGENSDKTDFPVLAVKKRNHFQSLHTLCWSGEGEARTGFELNSLGPYSTPL